MIESVTITHEKGLHARPASVFVQTASSFDADIEVTVGGNAADAKSSIQILSLSAEAGDELTIEANGSDEKRAVETLVSLVDSDFEEEIEA